jgi:hypothetical protein
MESFLKCPVASQINRRRSGPGANFPQKLVSFGKNFLPGKNVGPALAFPLRVIITDI